MHRQCNTWRGNIHYTLKTFFPSILWHWRHCWLTANLFAAFLLSQKNLFLLFQLICNGCHLFHWPEDKRGSDHSAWDLLLSALAQTEHDKCRHYHADVNTVALANPAVDQKHTVGQGDIRITLFTIRFYDHICVKAT